MKEKIRWKSIFMIAVTLIVFSGITGLVAAQTPVVPGPNDWAVVNYDSSYSRNSQQQVIGRDNVAQLTAKWIFNTGYAVENPPLIIGNTVYAQNNGMQVIAIDLMTGLCTWRFDPHVTYTGGILPRSSSSHGMAYENGIIYAPTGPNGTIIAINASNGAKIWESDLIDIGPAWRESAPPIIWNNVIVAGSALGDEPPFGVAQKGTVTGLDKATGKKLWQTQLAIGDWVTTSPNASQNGGATTWSGGAVDTIKGVIYLPVGNPSPDFQPDFRIPEPNKYANSVTAVDIATGKILWSTPFVEQGTVLKGLKFPDGHDWDTSWGTNLMTVDMGNGPQKIVIGHDKRGDVMALDAATGNPVWNLNVVYTQNTDQNPTPGGTDVVWPGPAAGVESFTATDGHFVYVAGSSTPVKYYSQQPDFLKGTGHLLDGGAVPQEDAIDNGYGNGTITKIDATNGRIVWQNKIANPTFVSPLVTNGVVFSGHVTDTGKPFTFSDFGGPSVTPLQPSGMIQAFDTNTGKLLWEFNLGGQCGVGGPSIGNGYLIVPVGGIQIPNNAGYVVAFGLP
jgi:alcohol dehydrogenase (cytochrome c)